MRGKIFDIQQGSFVDGPGVRTTVFFKGCNLSCRWCHNPEGQSFATQMLFYKDKCTGCGTCLRVCPTGAAAAVGAPTHAGAVSTVAYPCTFCGKCELYCPTEARRVCGKEYSAEEIVREAVRDRSFYESTGGGVTCSGGECMLQPDFLYELLERLKKASIHTAVDTAGNVPWESFERILPVTDMFLYDIKCADAQKHKEFTGVDNRLILENYGCLILAGCRLWVRIPIVPGVNDTPEDAEAINELFDRLGRPEKVELLPYHAMGEDKYRALGLEPETFAVPSGEKMKMENAFFANR